MKKTLHAVLTILCLALAGTVHAIDYDSWMSQLPDGWMLSRLSIPGTHNACTSAMSGSSKTQTLTLEAQLAGGVRLFDLRPRWDGSTMYIYHGITKTKIKFDDALQAISSFLDEHPTEFAFVIMRHESDGATSSQKNAWPDKMYECLSKQASHIVNYTPRLTVGDMRGKMLVMSRDAYSEAIVGAMLEGGGDNSVYERTIVGQEGERMRLTTQDMYDVAGSGELDNKVAELKKLLDEAIDEADYRLRFNHTSGYSKKILGISTAAGVKECATTCNNAVIEHMQGREGDGPMGYILMDFACDDDYQGQKLVDLIIRNNFSLLENETDWGGRIYRHGKVYEAPLGADRPWTGRTYFRSATTQSEGAVDALKPASSSWYKVDYNVPSSWKETVMPLGSPSYNQAYRTTWQGEYNCYWIRREFDIDRLYPDTKYYVECYHDDHFMLYVNDQLMLQGDNWTDPGDEPATKEIPQRLLRRGKNVISVLVQQNVGGAYFDCGVWRDYVSQQFHDETSLSAPVGHTSTPAVYNLAGERVTRPTKGIYVENGRKVLY